MPKPLPLMVTTEATGAEVGLTPVMRALIVKLVAVDPVPPLGVVTEIGPVEPDAGTVA